MNMLNELEFLQCGGGSGGGGGIIMCWTGPGISAHRWRHICKLIARSISGITDGTILSKLTQCKSSLQDKLAILNRLDEEILDVATEDEVEDEIKLGDVFKEKERVVVIHHDNNSHPGTGTRKLHYF